MKDLMEMLSVVMQWLLNNKAEFKIFFCFHPTPVFFFFFLHIVCRTQCLERGHTSPVTSAWLFSTVPTAAAGVKVSWVRYSAVLPCVKSLITQMSSARWRRKVCGLCDSLTQIWNHATLIFILKLTAHFPFQILKPLTASAREQRTAKEEKSQRSTL